MFALVKEAPGKGIVAKRVPIPLVGHKDVKIKIEKTSICGTDVHIYNWDEWAASTIKPPMTIGHEFVGRIVEVGDHVEGFKAGELVSGEGHIVCGKCRNCLGGRSHLCRNTQGVGVNRDGAFAEYLVIPATNVWRCSDKINPELYSCFDPLGNATHTALSFDLVGEDVLITGAGPIGIMAAGIASYCGARNVVITDVNDYRLNLAHKMGDIVTLNVASGSLDDVVEELGMKEGFDVGMEMSGSPSAFNDMVNHMHHGGKIALLGMPKKDTVIDWNKFIFSGLTIKGIYGREMFETWYKMTALLEGGFDISAVITHKFDVRDFEKGFEVMNLGKSGKVILDWTKL